jgi:hypothetical protein
MGWWDADEKGNSFAQGGLTWGDGPADVIDEALERIDTLFEQAWQRKPTLAEVQAGLMFSARVRYYEEES